MSRQRTLFPEPEPEMYRNEMFCKWAETMGNVLAIRRIHKLEAEYSEHA